MPEAVNICWPSNFACAFVSSIVLSWNLTKISQTREILILFCSFVLQYMESEQYTTTAIYIEQAGPWSLKKYF